MRRTIIITSTIAVIAFIAGAIANYDPAAATPRPKQSPPVYIPSREMLDAAHTAGLTLAQITSVAAQFGIPSTVKEPESGYVIGLYTGTVYVSPTSRDIPQTLAYEYEHHVWAQLTEQQRQAYTALLDDYYAHNQRQLEPGFTQLLSVDITLGSPNARYDELHSKACTETNDWNLRSDLLSRCNAEIPGRHNFSMPY